MDKRKSVAMFAGVAIVFALVFAGSLTIAGTAAANQSNLEINSVSISEETILEGESTNITAEVENTGIFRDRFEIRLEVDGNTVQSKTVSVPGRSTRDVSFDETFETSGTYSISVNGVSGGTVTVQEPASFEVTEASLSSDEIIEGDSVQTTATVENTGDQEGTFEAELQIDGQTVDSQSITVDGGGSEEVTFDRSFSDSGSYDVSVSGEAAGTLSVLTPPDIEVRTLTASPTNVLVGETVDIQATLENSGEATGDFEASLQVDGTTEATRTVTVEGESSEQVSFEQSFEQAGEYTVQVSGSETATVTVDRPAAFDITSTSISDSVIMEGESVRVSGTVQNVGDRSGTFTVRLIIDGSTEDTTSIDLDPGESDQVTFTERFSSSGNYDINIGDSPVGDLRVDQPATFEIDETAVNRSRTIPSNPISVDLTVANVGDREGSYTAVLTANGEQLSEREMTISGLSSQSVTFTEMLDEPGEYTFAVNGIEAGTVVVEEQPTLIVSNASIPADLVAPGQQTEVQFVVENPSNWTVTQSINVTADGEQIGAETVTLEPGERREMAVGFEATEAQIAVEGTDAGSLDLIQESGESNTETTENDDDSTSLFPIMLMVVILTIVIGISGTYVLKQRREPGGIQ